MVVPVDVATLVSKLMASFVEEMSFSDGQIGKRIRERGGIAGL